MMERHLIAGDLYSYVGQWHYRYYPCLRYGTSGTVAREVNVVCYYYQYVLQLQYEEDLVPRKPLNLHRPRELECFCFCPVSPRIAIIHSSMFGDFRSYMWLRPNAGPLTFPPSTAHKELHAVYLNLGRHNIGSSGF